MKLSWHRQVARVVWRTYEELFVDHVTILSAGIAFYGVFAVFQGLIFTVTVATLVLPREGVLHAAGPFLEALPHRLGELFASELVRILDSRAEAGVWALLSATWGLVAASGASHAVLSAINIAYDLRETRPWWRQRLMASVVLLGAILLLVVTAAVLVGIPAVTGVSIHAGGVPGLLLRLRWGLVFLAVVFAAGMLYRYVPNRGTKRWSHVLIGAAVAALVFVAGTVGLSLYVRHFGSGMSQTFGAVAGPAILLLWLQLCSYGVLLGAELNREIEAELGVDHEHTERSVVFDHGRDSYD